MPGEYARHCPPRHPQEAEYRPPRTTPAPHLPHPPRAEYRPAPPKSGVPHDDGGTGGAPAPPNVGSADHMAASGGPSGGPHPPARHRDLLASGGKEPRHPIKTTYVRSRVRDSASTPPRSTGRAAGVPAHKCFYRTPRDAGHPPPHYFPPPPPRRVRQYHDFPPTPIGEYAAPLPRERSTARPPPSMPPKSGVPPPHPRRAEYGPAASLPRKTPLLRRDGARRAFRARQRGPSGRPPPTPPRRPPARPMGPRALLRLLLRSRRRRRLRRPLPRPTAPRQRPRPLFPRRRRPIKQPPPPQPPGKPPIE